MSCYFIDDGLSALACLHSGKFDIYTVHSFICPFSRAEATRSQFPLSFFFCFLQAHTICREFFVISFKSSQFWVRTYASATSVAVSIKCPVKTSIPGYVRQKVQPHTRSGQWRNGNVTRRPIPSILLPIAMQPKPQIRFKSAFRILLITLPPYFVFWMTDRLASKSYFNVDVT